jgi:FkbM family methyltransferase
MNINKELKKFIPNKLKDLLKDKLGLKIEQWHPSDSIVIQRYIVSALGSKFTFEADGKNPLNHTVYDHDCYFLKEISPKFEGAYVFDIGANVGVFSVVAKKLGANVLAVEPDPSNVRQMMQNMRENNLEFPVLAKACSPNADLIEFVMSNSVGNSAVIKSGEIRKSFDSITLQSLLTPEISLSKKRKIVKMDIEGMEHQIFRRDFDHSQFDIYVIEVHDLNRGANLETFIAKFGSQFEVKVKPDAFGRNFLNTVYALKV